MNSSDSNTQKKRIKVRCLEGEVINLHLTQDISFNMLMKDVCNKINKITYDGSSVTENDISLFYKDGAKERELVDIRILFNDDAPLLYVKRRKNSKFSNLKSRDYLKDVLSKYNSQDAKFNIMLWLNSAKEVIKDHLYQCVFESSSYDENVKNIINLLYILYNYFETEKSYISILKTVSKIEISRIVFSKYILKICDKYYNKVHKGYINGEESEEDNLLIQSLCFLSSYQKTIDEKWEVKTIKSIIEKLKPIERYLSVKLKEYYSIINSYLSLYDDDSIFIDSIPIIPTYEEIHSNEDMVFSMLRDNKQSGYKSVREYLSTHYLLLRADVLLPLQETVNIASNKGSNNQNSCCFLYNNVKCKKFDFNLYNGMLYEIEFDKPSPDFDWRFSKRLQFGSLLCITPDNYKTLIWCTLADRKFLDDDIHNSCLRPQITVKMLASYDDSVGRLEFGLNYQMAESPEKYTLMSLRSKICNPTYELPFKINLVDGCETISHPSYISESTTYKMKSVFRNHENLRILDKWPSYEECESLDESQLEALKNMLTKEISLIQGPPGTGKTYVGSLAVKILLENHQYDGPILVVCYTNHALDQFLETFTDVLKPGELVRVGGRCKSEKLEEYSLKLLLEIQRKGLISMMNFKLKQRYWKVYILIILIYRLRINWNS